MDECKDTWYPFSWYCPNCGTQLIGFKNAEGMIKVECKRCIRPERTGNSQDLNCVPKHTIKRYPTERLR